MNETTATILSDVIETTVSDTSISDVIETTLSDEAVLLDVSETTTFLFDTEINSLSFETSYNLCTSFLALFVLLIIIMKGASNI